MITGVWPDELNIEFFGCFIKVFTQYNLNSFSLNSKGLHLQSPIIGQAARFNRCCLGISIGIQNYKSFVTFSEGSRQYKTAIADYRSMSVF